MNQHIVIEAVAPSVDGGRYAVKRVVGDRLTVQADVLRDGHEQVAAALRFRWRDAAAEAAADTWQAVPMPHHDNDRFVAAVALDQVGELLFCVDGWTDVYGSWLHGLRRKVEAGVEVKSELTGGAQLLLRAAAAAPPPARAQLEAAAALVGAPAVAAPQALAVASSAACVALVTAHLPRLDVVTSGLGRVSVDPVQARFSTWYEMFPRSQGSQLGRPATLRQASRRLPDIRAMGFDVLYLPPIHPIGTVHRKGPNNALHAGPDDPGCPWAIGSAHGGHDAIEPALGTLADFDAFVAACAEQGLALALDYALQCAPDHPWVQAHPAWFVRRPDGSIQYAENPPKKYEDVYPLNFDTEERDALWAALRDLLLFWIDHGVRIFRVDNPHTKPFDFWEWVIGEVRRRHPDVIFLSEAFTRPKVMRCLAKLGFSQSYTYFTWRNDAAELRDYLTELTEPGSMDCLRPNFWPNTPDILPTILQHGGKPAFLSRLLLAATLSPSYGIYSGYELCENAAIAGREEYLDSEKYAVRVRDWNAPGNIKDFIARLNRIRAEHPALQHLDGLHFCGSDNDRLLAYVRRRGDDALVVVVNLDPHAPHHGTCAVPMAALGLPEDGRFAAADLLCGATYDWGARNYVRLDPQVQVAHVLHVRA